MGLPEIRRADERDGRSQPRVHWARMADWRPPAGAPLYHRGAWCHLGSRRLLARRGHTEFLHLTTVNVDGDGEAVAGANLAVGRGKGHIREAAGRRMGSDGRGSVQAGGRARPNKAGWDARAHPIRHDHSQLLACEGRGRAVFFTQRAFCSATPDAARTDAAATRCRCRSSAASGGEERDAKRRRQSSGAGMECEA